jgi:hypothetical protein
LRNIEKTRQFQPKKLFGHHDLLNGERAEAKREVQALPKLHARLRSTDANCSTSSD